MHIGRNPHVQSPRAFFVHENDGFFVVFEKLGQTCDVVHVLVRDKHRVDVVYVHPYVGERFFCGAVGHAAVDKYFCIRRKGKSHIALASAEQSKEFHLIPRFSETFQNLLPFAFVFFAVFVKFKRFGYLVLLFPRDLVS